jgi:hypothetical protein
MPYQEIRVLTRLEIFNKVNELSNSTQPPDYTSLIGTLIRVADKDHNHFVVKILEIEVGEAYHLRMYKTPKDPSITSSVYFKINSMGVDKKIGIPHISPKPPTDEEIQTYHQPQKMFCCC